MEKISITKDININDWNSILQNSKDINIFLSQEYYDSLNHENKFLRALMYQRHLPIAVIQGKIYIIKNIYFLKKLVIGSMSGSGIAIVDSKKDQRNKIYTTLMEAVEKEKIDVIELWTLDKVNLQGYINNEVYTIILKFDKDLESQWAHLDRKTRNLIRKAQKNNVSIQIENSHDFEKCYELYRETAERGNFDAIEYKSLKDATEKFTRKNMLKVFSAYFGKKIVSFAYILCYKDCTYYWMGASNKKGHEVAASNLLQWKVIEWARDNNYVSYNMWGADPNPSSKSYGVYKFKIGFGGDLIKIYTYRKYLSGLAMMLYSLRDFYSRIKEKL